MLFLMNRFFGMMGIVWTQAIADLCTVFISYIVYGRVRRQEGWPAGL